MAPLDPLATYRLYVDYTTINGDHTLLVRFPSESSLGLIAATMDAYYNLMTNILADTTTIVRERLGAPGTPVTNPFRTIDFVGAGPPQNLNQGPLTAAAVGRDSAGRRVRHFWFGHRFIQTENFRVTPAESAFVADLLSFLNDPGTFIVTIAGIQPVWSNYLSMQYNVHEVKNQRRNQG